MTRLILSFIVLLVLAPARGVAEQNDKPVDLTGKWAMALDMSVGPSEPLLELKQDGGKVTGTYIGRYGSFALTGAIKARKVTFTFAMGPAAEPIEMTFTGEVSADGESMKGDATLGIMGDGTWTAKRERTK